MVNQMIIYAPILLALLSMVALAAKIKKKFLSIVEAIIGHSTIKELKKEIKGLREQLACVSIRMYKLETAIMEKNLKVDGEKSNDGENEEV